jgi:hypothetical protein
VGLDWSNRFWGQAAGSSRLSSMTSRAIILRVQ